MSESEGASEASFEGHSETHGDRPDPGRGAPGEGAIETPTDIQPIVVTDGPDETERLAPLPYLVVGVGASAGGVEAYLELFKQLAPDTGMSFVVIPHLLADHKSHLVEILSRSTTLPISEIVDGVRPEPDHIYVLPPNTRARLNQGVLRLDARVPDGLPRSIDYFFRSLGAEQKTRAVGVVLSGTDADGALGLKAIKGEGGIAIVQSPETARFSEMPRSSISMDHVDRILPPDQIAHELAQLGRQFRQPTVRTLEEGAPQHGEEQHFFRILNLMRGVSGVDFRLYKPTTIRRRIARRMMLHRIQSLAEYAAFLNGNAKELRELQEDALINVTRFFRDPAVFDTLKQVILPRILDSRGPDQPVRIWVAGCSSGEEAYSIAICLLEYLTGQAFEPPIQIFGTDASEENIQRARAGIFPESIAGEVSPDRLRRFFVKVDRGYQVSKRVRDLCIFARQNLSHDPPFSKMDLISCRNVLIYMGAELQKQILPTFHYALRPTGYLLLGTSETIREFTDLFQLVDRKHKFFARIGSTNGTRGILAVAPHLFLPEAPLGTALTSLAVNWGDVELQRAADRIVLARYAPPGVVIDEKQEILQSRGHTAPYLEMPQGAAVLQLSRMLRESIAMPVSQAVRHALEQDVPVRVEGLEVREDDERHFINVEVLPIHTNTRRSRCLLVLFAPASPARIESEPAETPVPLGRRDQLVERLRQDLASTKLYLQTLLEERDAKHQELVSANEEIQSANEELQSTNEELETTKEELQSSNEELQTVNDELQQRNLVLMHATNDLSNLLNSVNLPVLMLSQELHIRHFTPPTQRLMNLRSQDIGRPFSEIRLNLNVQDLAPLFHDVLETLTPRELEVQDREGQWYLLRVRPYRTTDNKIDGIVVVLLDIDQLRRSQHDLSAARDFSSSIIESIPLPLAVVDPDFNIREVNDAFRHLTGLAKADARRRSLPDLVTSALGLDQPLRSNLEKLKASGDVAARFEFAYDTPGDNPRAFFIRGQVLKPDSEMYLLVTIEDVTSHKEMERLLSLEREQLANEVASKARELGSTKDELRALAGSLFTVREQERRRVAGELEEAVRQRLARLETEIGNIAERLPKSPAETARAVERVRSGIAEANEQARRIADALQPPALQSGELAVALKALVDDFRHREGMIVTFSAKDVPPKVPERIAAGLYRIAEEALNNIAAHAGKTHVKLTLTPSPSGIRLQVLDSGNGFDMQARTSGLGLIAMEERARMLDGSFTVESEPGAGTRVTVEIPNTSPQA